MWSDTLEQHLLKISISHESTVLPDTAPIFLGPVKDITIDIGKFKDDLYPYYLPEVFDPNANDTYIMSISGLEKTFMSVESGDLDELKKLLETKDLQKNY